MLVLVSDLHISDTTTANNVNPEAIALLASDILEMAGRRGAREIRLVLLGDIFDLVRTDYWHRHSIPLSQRPWGGKLDPVTAMNVEAELVEQQFSQVLAGVLATDLAGELARRIGEIAERAPLTVTYVIGNHERVLWNFPSLRGQITAAVPQIHEFAAAVESSEYGVLARHGHEWDEQTHGWRLLREVLDRGSAVGRFDEAAYRVMAIGEAVTAELMGGLIHHARSLGATSAVVDQLKEVNNLRPVLDVFAWLEWLGGTKSQRDREVLHRALREALDGLLETSLARLWDRLTPDLLVSGDLVDRLQEARSLLLGGGFDAFEGRVEALKTAQRLFPFLSPTGDRLLEGAEQEAVFGTPRPGPIQRVIYGHTHRARHDYFAAEPAGAVKMYVNTGTFLPLIQRTRDGRSFANSIQLTMVYVYRSDEDTERKAPDTTSLDIWNGIRRKQYV